MEFIFIILSSLLFTIPNYFPNLFFLSWFAFIPLIYLIREYDYSHSFIIAVLVGFLNSVFSLYWIYHPLNSVLKMPFSFNIFILFLYFLFSALPLGFWVLINKFLQPEAEESYSPLIAALSWSVLEYLRFEFLNLNPFNYFAYTQSSFNFIVRYAAYGGIFLVSFISVLIASYLVKLFFEPNWKKAVPLAIILIILTIIPFFTASQSEISFRKTDFDLLINNPQGEGSIFENIENEIDNFAYLLAKKQSKYIFTAEDSLNFDLVRNSYYREKFFSNIESELNGSYLQLGSHAAASANYNAKVLNSLFLLSENLEIINRSNQQLNFLAGVNFKNKEKIVNFFAAYLNFNKDILKKNKDTKVIKLDELRFVNLTAEEIFIPIGSRSNNYPENTNLIVNSAAEGKFDSKLYNNLTLAAAVYRAAESSTALIRAVSGGYSAAVDYRGKIIMKKKIENDLKSFNLNLYQGQSYYQKNPTKIINIILIIFAIITFVKVMVKLRKELSSRN